MNEHASQTSYHSPPRQLDPNEVHRELERILKSRAFRNAPLLQRFLTYVTQKALEGRGEDIKEYLIATEVLNRSSDFDPKISPLVRVEARRLRERLTQYYSNEGAADAIVFNIPRGGYVPTFEWQHGHTAGVPTILESEFPLKDGAIQPSAQHKKVGIGQLTRDKIHSLQRFGNRRVALTLLSLVSIAAFILLVARLSVTIRPSSITKQTQPNMELRPDTLLLKVWSNLMGNGRTAYVFYYDRDLRAGSSDTSAQTIKEGTTNPGAPQFPAGSVGKYANQVFSTKGLLSLDNALVGAGELQGVYALTRLLVRLGIPIEVHGCQALPKDVISQRTVFLLGPELEKELRSFRPAPVNFIFDGSTAPKGMPSKRILNLQPRAGEQPSYETQSDPRFPDIIHDWAILSVLPGVKEQRKTVVMAGLTHMGTQGVAELCASGTGAVTLLDHLGSGESLKELPNYYQVLLRVTIKQGTISDIAYVAGRILDAAP
jgi:hypothetical protein